MVAHHPDDDTPTENELPAADLLANHYEGQRVKQGHRQFAGVSPYPRGPPH